MSDVERREKICRTCGKTFTPKRHMNQMDCSAKCAHEHHLQYMAKYMAERRRGRTEKEAECAFCGKTFKRWSARHRFCSAKCREMAKRKKPEKKTCAVCGAEFEAKYWRQVCCSKECSAEYGRIVARRYYDSFLRMPRHEVTCVVCGKRFAPKNPNTKTCSAECRTAYRKKVLAAWHLERKARALAYAAEVREIHGNQQR